MKNLLLTLTLLVLSTPVQANCNLQPDAVLVPLASYHHNATREFNESSLGLVVGWDCKDLRVGLGAYRNSFNEVTGVATLSYRFSIEGFYVDPFIGLADYGEHTITGDPIIPIVGVTVRHKDVPVCVQVIPGSEEHLNFSWLGVFALCTEF